MATVLEIWDLHKRYGPVRAVDGLRLRLQKGEIFGLVGPDGAGKTTAMRMINGLITPDRGQIRALDHLIPFEARSARRRIGYMPQQYSLYGDLSVQENLRFFAGMFGLRRKQIREREKRLLSIARLEPYRHRPAGALSGGMYKKLALSCALIHRPDLLLLDEPTNGVDPISRRELWAFLYELVNEGMTVLVTTPYMDEAERCDRVGLLVAGKLAAQGSPADLRAQFKETVFEIAAQPQIRAKDRLLRLEGLSRVYTVGKKLHASSPRGEGFAREIRDVLAESGIAVTSLEPVPPSFEDIFMHMAGAPAAPITESSPSVAD